MEKIFDTKVNINSILLAIVITVSMSSKIFNYLTDTELGTPVITICVFLMAVFFNGMKFTKSFLVFNIFFIIFLVASFAFSTDTTYTFKYLQYYIMYGITISYLCQNKFNYNKINQIIMLVMFFFTILLVMYYFPYIRRNASINLDFTMDLSYTCLVGVVTYLFMDKKNYKMIINLILLACVAINIYYLLFMNNNRGSLLVLFIAIIWKFQELFKGTIQKYIFIFISFVSLTAIYLNLYNLLVLIEQFSTSILGYTPYWLRRLFSQIGADNVSTGRVDLYENALNMISKHPFLGNGVGKFEIYNDGLFIHNVILEFFVEFGLIFGMILFLVIVYGFFMSFDTQNDESLLLRNIFILSIPRLMISNSFWQFNLFWIFLFIVFRRLFKKVTF